MRRRDASRAMQQRKHSSTRAVVTTHAGTCARMHPGWTQCAVHAFGGAEWPAKHSPSKVKPTAIVRFRSGRKARAAAHGCCDRLPINPGKIVSPTPVRE